MLPKHSAFPKLLPWKTWAARNHFLENVVETSRPNGNKFILSNTKKQLTKCNPWTLNDMAVGLWDQKVTKCLELMNSIFFLREQTHSMNE